MSTTLDFGLKKVMPDLCQEGRWNTLTVLILHANIRNRCWPNTDTIADMSTNGNRQKAIDNKKWLLEHKAFELVPYNMRLDEEKALPKRQHVYQLTGYVELPDESGQPRRYHYLYNLPNSIPIETFNGKSFNGNTQSPLVLESLNESPNPIKDSPLELKDYVPPALTASDTWEGDPDFLVQDKLETLPIEGTVELPTANPPPSIPLVSPSHPSMEIILWNENAKYTVNILSGDTKQKNIAGFVVTASELTEKTSDLPELIKLCLLNAVRKLQTNTLKLPKSDLFMSMNLEVSHEESLTANNSQNSIGINCTESVFLISLQINRMEIWVGTVVFAVSTTTNTLSLTLTASFPDQKAVSIWRETCEFYAPIATNAKPTNSKAGSLSQANNEDQKQVNGSHAGEKPTRSPKQLARDHLMLACATVWEQEKFDPNDSKTQSFVGKLANFVTGKVTTGERGTAGTEWDTYKIDPEQPMDAVEVVAFRVWWKSNAKTKTLDFPDKPSTIQRRIEQFRGCADYNEKLELGRRKLDEIIKAGKPLIMNGVNGTGQKDWGTIAPFSGFPGDDQ